MTDERAIQILSKDGPVGTLAEIEEMIAETLTLRPWLCIAALYSISENTIYDLRRTDEERIEVCKAQGLRNANQKYGHLLDRKVKS